MGGVGAGQRFQTQAEESWSQSWCHSFPELLVLPTVWTDTHQHSRTTQAQHHADCVTHTQIQSGLHCLVLALLYHGHNLHWNCDKHYTSTRPEPPRPTITNIWGSKKQEESRHSSPCFSPKPASETSWSSQPNSHLGSPTPWATGNTWSQTGRQSQGGATNSRELNYWN